MAGLGQTIGMGLANYGNALPQIQQMQEQQKQRQQQAALAQVLRQYAAQQGQPPALPGAAPAMPGQQAQGMPGQTPGVSPSGGAPNPFMGGGTPNPATGGGQAAGSFAGGMPNLDQMITALGKSGLSDDQQFQALQKYGAFSTPYEKMLQQMELKQKQLDATSDNLSVRMQAMRDIAAARNQTAERGQDVRADTAASGQEIARQRADTYEQSTAGRLLQGEEGLKVKQQNADTASDRAGTYKYGTMEGTKIKQQNADTGAKREASQENLGQKKIDLAKLSLQEKNKVITAGQDKQYQARLASIASRGTSEQQAAFKAAQTEFTQASSDYRNAKISPNSNMQDIKDMADKAALAQQKMESEAAKIGASVTAPSAGKPPTISTQAEYDKLPPGAQYMDENGGPYTKK